MSLLYNHVSTDPAEASYEADQSLGSNERDREHVAVAL